MIMNVLCTCILYSYLIFSSFHRGIRRYKEGSGIDITKKEDCEIHVEREERESLYIAVDFKYSLTCNFFSKTFLKDF